MKTLTLTPNQANLLILATELTKCNGLTIGMLGTVRSLSKKLHALAPGEPEQRKLLDPEGSEVQTVTFEDGEFALMRSFWCGNLDQQTGEYVGGFDLGLLPRGPQMLDLIESVGAALNPTPNGASVPVADVTPAVEATA